MDKVLTPGLVADMDVKMFMEMCKRENVTNLKVMADCCGMAIAELQGTYAILYDVTMKKYASVVEDNAGEIAEALNTMAMLTMKIGELNVKREIALKVFGDKTPECFRGNVQ